MIEKIKNVLLVVLVAAICMGAAVTSSPYDGTGWNTGAPNDEAIVGNSYQELQDLRKGVELRINKEHITLASSSAGGEHLQGSARIFFQDAAPTTQVDGTAWVDPNDLGSIWCDTNSTPDNQLNILTAISSDVWTPVSTEVIAVLLASNRQFAGTLTVDGTTTLTGAVTANGGITLGAGDDLIGSSTSDITFNTNKFTVVGATGNTVIAGTASVGGTLDVTGNIDPTTYETTNGGFLDEDDMASAATAADKVASQQSIKAYVDADHPAYSGGESHTDGSGLIIKMGEVAVGASTTDTTVTFGTAFPTACISVVTGVRQSSGQQMTYSIGVFSITKTSFHFSLTVAANVNGITWIAVGH